MAEITRSGPLAGVRSLDFATAVTGVCASRTFGDLGADVIMLAPPMTRCVGQRTSKCTNSSSKPPKRFTALTHPPNSARNVTAATRRVNGTSLCQTPQQQREQRD
jgi:crotonobetainyl-CoA:carnitine CoA-transferase CaiB-like acyl-CoA transferase